MGTNVTHVPYRGAGPALQDLITGQVDVMFDGLGSSAQHIKSGRLAALAVASNKRVAITNCRGAVRQVLDIANFSKLFQIK